MGEVHTVNLDMTKPMERALYRMLEMNRRKSADYASEQDVFLNFRVNADMMRLEGYTYIEDCLSMVCRKVNRITNLRGKSPQNESVLDSYEDLAVYAALLFAMALEEADPPTRYGIGIDYESVPGARYEGDDK